MSSFFESKNPLYKLNMLSSSILISLLLLLLSLQIVKCQEMVSESELTETYSSGAYFEQLDVNLYDKVIPLIFKFSYPDWLEQNRVHLSTNCTDDKWIDNSVMGSLCPVFYYLQNELSNKLDDAMALPTLSISPSSLATKFDCDHLSKHFFVERLTNDKFTNYLIKLRKCSGGKIFESDLITEMSKKIQFTYDIMVRKFVEEYSTKLPNDATDARVHKAEELNDKIALSGLLYAQYLTLVKKWRLGYKQCKLGGFIPDSFVQISTLRSALKFLSRKIGSLNEDNSTYGYTLSDEGTQISRYYKAPIADCVYTEDKFIVRILVPITKIRKSSVKLVEINAIPFYVSEGTGPPQLCMLDGFARSKQFSTSVEELSSGLVTSLATEVICDYTNFNLCHIPDPYDTVPNPMTICARAIILYNYNPNNENDALVVAKCPLHCTDLRAERFPIIVRSKQDPKTVYLITDPQKPNPGIDLECQRDAELDEDEEPNPNGEPKKETYVKRLPSLAKGSLALILSCNCRLAIGAHNILAAPDCLEDELMLFKIIPFHHAVSKGNNSSLITNTTTANQQAVVKDDDAA